MPWLTKGWQVYFIRLFTFLFGVLGEAREMGKSSRIATAGAIAYERLPLIVTLLSKTEVARRSISGIEIAIVQGDILLGEDRPWRDKEIAIADPSTLADDSEFASLDSRLLSTTKCERRSNRRNQHSCPRR